MSFVLFADDTTVYVQNDSIDGAIEILNTELAKVALWFDSNKLTLNVNKTQMIMLSRKKNLTPQNEVILRNEVVQRVNKAKFLGVIVDQHLNWKDHISMITQKMSKSCGIIYRIRNTLDIKSKRLIYYSLIHPYLTYCVNVWSSTYRTNLKMVCTAQKRSVRALFATAQQPHSRDIFLNQRILPLDKLINQQEGILAYKVISGTYLLGDILTDRHDLHHYQLRNDENLRIPLHSTTHSQLFIRYRAIKTWNSLSDDLRSASSLTSFKKKLKLMLHQQ